MNGAAGDHEAAVALEEHGRRQAGVLASGELRVGESEPDFRNLGRSEECSDEFDAGPKESHVGKCMLSSILRAFPEPRALDVYAYVVHGRIALGKGYRVLSPAAAKLQDYGIAIPEHVPSPVALDGVVAQDQFPRALDKDLRGRRLKQAAEGLVLCKFL